MTVRSPGSSVEDTTPAGLFSIRYTGPPPPMGAPSTVTAAVSGTFCSGARHTVPSAATRPARISSRASFRLHVPVFASRLSSRSIPFRSLLSNHIGGNGFISFSEKPWEGLIA